MSYNNKYRLLWKEVTRMTEQEIEKLVQDKLNEAYKENEPPKKFFLTENGRGVVDGGDARHEA